MPMTILKEPGGFCKTSVTLLTADAVLFIFSAATDYSIAVTPKEFVHLGLGQITVKKYTGVLLPTIQKIGTIHSATNA